MLEALVKHYENLAAEGKVPRPGWSKVKVSFALRLDELGNVVQLLDLRKDGSRDMWVPEQSQRSGKKIKPQFLCDNCSYILGINDKNGLHECEERFKAAAEMHKNILEKCSSKMANSVKRFFSNWDIKKIEQCECLKADIEEILKGSNITFMLEGDFATEDEEIKEVWEEYIEKQGETKKSQCLVTGEIRTIARLHPDIKGVRGSLSKGGKLVSFNERAYESYGHDNGQGLNAPVSEYAAFAYTTALNVLLADSSHVSVFGDTTLVYWAEKDNETYQDCFGGFCLQDENIMEDKDLTYIFSCLKKDEPINYKGIDIEYENKFYILGLSPNAARLSVRFFLQSDFGSILKNAAKHMADMELVHPSYKRKHIPLWLMLAATVSPKSKDRAASPLLSGAVLKSILMGRNYPASFFQYVMLRIRSEQDDTETNPPVYKITYERCAVIKAYLCRNGKRGITVALNENENDVAYVLGRIFAVWEHIQAEANKGINATIKDRYFDSICATPARIFPILQKLSSHHLRKLEDGRRIFFEKQLTSLMGKINAGEIPNILPLKEQGMFVLGYYHQVQVRYAKKEDKDNG